MISLPGRIKHLGLVGCMTSGDWFQGISDALPQLEIADLRESSKLTNVDMINIIQCENIKVLHLSGCYRLTSLCLQKTFSQLKDLRILSVKDTEMDELALSCLAANQTKLESLSLGHKNREKRKLLPSKVLLCQLPAFKKMKHLDLNMSMAEADTVNAIKNLPLLQTLNLQDSLVEQDDLELILTGLDRKLSVNVAWTDEMQFEFDKS